MNQLPPPWDVIVSRFISREGLQCLCRGVAGPFCDPCVVSGRYLIAANDE